MPVGVKNSEKYVTKMWLFACQKKSSPTFSMSKSCAFQLTNYLNIFTEGNFCQGSIGIMVYSVRSANFLNHILF